MIKNFISTLWGAPDKGIYEEPDPADLTVENAYRQDGSGITQY